MEPKGCHLPKKVALDCFSQHGLAHAMKSRTSTKEKDSNDHYDTLARTSFDTTKSVTAAPETLLQIGSLIIVLRTKIQVVKVVVKSLELGSHDK